MNEKHVLRKYLNENPVLTGLGIVTLYFAFLAAPALTSSKAFGGDTTRSPTEAPAGQLPWEIALAVSVIAIVAFLGWVRESRLLSRPAWGGLWYTVIPGLIILAFLGISFVGGMQNQAGFNDVLARGSLQEAFLLAIFVAIFEEVLFRGILLHGLEKRLGAVAALLVSSALFGAMHYVNWVEGQDLASTHTQVVHAALAGFLYGAITLRTRSLWPGILLHALWDFTVFANSALLGDMAALAPTDGAASDLRGGMIAFILQNFEPIFGLLALLGWYRWSRRSNA